MNQLRLCRRCRAGRPTRRPQGVPRSTPLSPARAFAWITGGKELGPALDDFLIGPGRGTLGIDPQQNMQMIIHDGKPAHGYREDLAKLREPLFQSIRAVERIFPFAKQRRTSNTPRDAVIPACNREIDEPSPSDGHVWSPESRAIVAHLRLGDTVQNCTLLVNGIDRKTSLDRVSSMRIGASQRQLAHVNE